MFFPIKGLENRKFDSPVGPAQTDEGKKLIHLACFHVGATQLQFECGNDCKTNVVQGELTKASSQLAALLHTNTFIIQTQLKNVARRAFKAFWKMIFFALHSCTFQPTNTARRLPG